MIGLMHELNHVMKLANIWALTSCTFNKFTMTLGRNRIINTEHIVTLIRNSRRSTFCNKT